MGHLERDRPRGIRLGPAAPVASVNNVAVGKPVSGLRNPDPPEEHLAVSLQRLKPEPVRIHKLTAAALPLPNALATVDRVNRPLAL